MAGPLARELRRELDKAIVEARRLAEAAARAGLERLGVIGGQAPVGESDEARRLRLQLQAKRRAEGHERLIEEMAYEQWHRMLFARFLAENGLLLHPEGAPVTLAEVRDLAAEEGERDPWLLAARYAARMLPGIFRADDPANRVTFAPEDRSRLEAVLERLPTAVFTSDDGLGWVYQFWQSQRKEEVNKRGDKIGGADLPAVTQLFTEHYMVRFLLENSLGAWWAGRHPNSPLLNEWEYLRFRDDGTPAAGTFEGWPTTAAEITVMDPCCGSGHFLVAGADMLRKMRTEEEGLSPSEAAAAVIRDNLFGLELDARCLQLAAFNVALDAWRAGGYQPLPIPNLACTGIAIKGQRADWQRLAGDDERMKIALDRLYDLFQDAPELGSLIDPRSAAGEGLWSVDVDKLLAKLDKALQREQTTDPAAAVFGEAAAGTAKAAQLLAGRYWLVATNPPFLGRGQQPEPMTKLMAVDYPDSRADLGTAFAERSVRALQTHGSAAVVNPQNWLFLGSYKRMRVGLIKSTTWQMVARLGASAFSTPMWAFNTMLLIVSRTLPSPSAYIVTLDVSPARRPSEKARDLLNGPMSGGPQDEYAAGADSVIGNRPASSGTTLSVAADPVHGLSPGDMGRHVRKFWEASSSIWSAMSSTPTGVEPWSGKTDAIRNPTLIANFNDTPGFRPDGGAAWGRRGVQVGKMGSLPASLYQGEFFDANSHVLIAHNPAVLPAVWAFALSPAFSVAVREIDQKADVTTSTLAKVPFDLEHWQKVAADQYPNGLPEPQSDDPTQWLFKGSVVGSESPLQVSVARLLGYRWPDQEPDDIDELTDPDGLVTLPSVGGERSAAERLRTLLARAYGDEWSPQLLERLLAEAGSPGATLETWLRDDFFAQHAKLFHQRPFIWHVWDGRKDGFSVLCHFHRLDRAKLEKLTYTLLNDWIERQRAARDEPGAEARLNAPLTLQEKLALILEGEAPYDIHVRWKSLAEQPIGWEPDLDDGVRLNIRPFVTANVLRAKVNVKWDKDRGKNPDGSDRINDHHPTLAQKRASRAAGKA